jgi:hypothetical protein
MELMERDHFVEFCFVVEVETDILRRFLKIESLGNFEALIPMLLNII